MRGSGDLPAKHAKSSIDDTENRMPLTVAVQMDTLESINVAGDSTFALMLSAQTRGHRRFHYTADALNYADGRVWANAHPVTVERAAGKHFDFGDPVDLDLGEAAEVVLM